MAKPTIITRAGKGSALTWTEGDANLTNLRDATISVTDGTNTKALNLNDTLTFTAGTNVTLSVNSSTGAVTINSSNPGGTVTSAGMSVPTGLSVSPSSITSSGTFAISLAAGYSIPTTASQTNWDSAYTQRLQWDGGSSNLVASTGRTSLGATTVGANLFTLTNPTAVTFLRVNADNTISALDAATFRTAIGAGTSSTTGTVTSVGGTGTVNGLTLTGTVTSSGSLTLGGTLDLSSPPAIGGTTASTGRFTTITSTIATGTAPFTVASTTNVANLNASSLNGATFASPGNIGSGTPGSGSFTTVAASTTTNSGAINATYNPATSTGAAIQTSGGITQGGAGFFDFLKATNTTSGATNANKSFRINSTGAIEVINSAYSTTILSLTDAGALTVPSATINGSLTIKDLRETVYTSGATTGTITPDVANGTVQKITLTGNITFNAFANPVAGQSLTLIITQSSGGNNTLTSTMKFSGGTKTLSTAGSSIDILTVFYDGSTYWASLAKGFA